MRKSWPFLMLSTVLTVSLSTTDDVMGAMAPVIVRVIFNSKPLLYEMTYLIAGKMRFRSHDPFLKLNETKYYFLPESIGWAVHDHPESIHLSEYNSSCLESWEQQFLKLNESWRNHNPYDWYVNHNGLFNSEECGRRWRREGGCRFDSISLGPLADELVFPDGRSFEAVIWNCSSEMKCCGEGCCPRYSTVPPKNIAPIGFKIFYVVTFFACFLVFPGIHYYYRRRKTQERVDTGPIRAKNEACGDGSVPDRRDITSPPPLYSTAPEYPPSPDIPSCSPPSQPPPPYAHAFLPKNSIFPL